MNKRKLIKKYKKEFFFVRTGMTFSEVIITIAVFSIIMVGVNQLFIKSWKNYNFVIKTNEASVAANRGASKIVDDLRKANNANNGSYALAGVGDFDLKFFSNIDDDVDMERVHYYLSGTNLMMGKTNPTGSPANYYPSEDSEVSLLIKNVTNTASQPLFYYYDGRNNIIASPSTNISDIRMIKVNLVIDRGSNDINIESYASMRNLSDYDTIR